MRDDQKVYQLILTSFDLTTAANSSLQEEICDTTSFTLWFTLQYGQSFDSLRKKKKNTYSYRSTHSITLGWCIHIFLAPAAHQLIEQREI